jgi:hypothetical protein
MTFLVSENIDHSDIGYDKESISQVYMFDFT